MTVTSGPIVTSTLAALASTRALQQSEGLVNRRTSLQLLCRQIGSRQAAELENIGDHAVHLDGNLLDGAGVIAAGIIQVPRAVLEEGVHITLEIAQRRPQVMCHGIGEGLERPVGLLELLIALGGAAHLGHVFHEHISGVMTIHAHAKQGNVHTHRFAIAGLELDFALRRVVAVLELLQLPADRPEERIAGTFGLPLETIDQRLAGPIGVEHFALHGRSQHAYVQPVEEGVQSCFGAQSAQPDLGTIETGSHRHGETHIVLGTLDDVIVETRLHRLDGNLLCAGRGEHDHRTVRASLLDRANDVHTVRPLQIEVGDDDVERRTDEGIAKLWVVQRLEHLDVRKLLAELSQRELPIMRIVVENERAKR